MLPSTIVPMQPVPVREPFDSSDYTFQVKWDGIRLLSFVGEGEVRLQNRRLRDRSLFYPELLVLPGLLRADAVVLDGEVIVPGSKGSNFPAVLRREQVTTGKRALALAEEVPICYMVFDILFADGQPLLSRSLTERQGRLREILSVNAVVQIVENFTSGKALFTAVKEAGLEGIVAKKKSSPYVPGTRSRAWQKIKVRRRQLCLVGGYLSSGQRLRSLLVGAWQGERLIYLGRVGTGLTKEEEEILVRILPQLSTPDCPFDSCLQAEGVRWLHPVLPIAVEFSEWTESLHLRGPSIAGFPKVQPTECRLEG